MKKLSLKLFDLISRIPIPVFLLALCILAYGVLAPWLGFYMDDWYIILFNKLFGALNFPRFFQSDRPLFAYVYMVFVPIFKDSRVAWQLFAVFTRWLSVCSFWYLLKLILPKRNQLTLASAILFAVYPGFQFHWFSVMYSQVFFLMAVYFLSYILMILAIRSKRYRMLILLAALISQFVGIAPMEYFFGLELARPIVLFIVLASDYENKKERFLLALFNWLPYLIVLIGFTVFRIIDNQSYSYKIQIFSEIHSFSFTKVLTFISTIIWSVYDSILQVWLNLSAIFKRNLITGSSLFMIGLIIIGFILTILVLRNQKNEFKKETDAKYVILFGLFLTLTAMVPFLVGGFAISLDFPNNRFLLALSPGIALTVIGIITAVFKTEHQKVVFISILAGLSIGSQFLAARTFMLYWGQQKDYFAQLTWRVPGLKQNTILATNDLNFSQYYSGGSLTAPLNLIYAPNNSSEQIPYLMFLSLSGQSQITSLANPDTEINYDFRGFEFNGNTSSVLVFSMPSTGCLRILDNDDISLLLQNDPTHKSGFDALPRSDTNLILANPENPVTFPEKYFGKENTNQWCYYFEKADLARQQAKWQEVIDLYAQADKKGFMPNNAYEWVPLIEAYAHTSQIQKASEISNSLELSENATKNIACAAWQKLGSQITNPDDLASINNVFANLQCQKN